MIRVHLERVGARDIPRQCQHLIRGGIKLRIRCQNKIRIDDMASNGGLHHRIGVHSRQGDRTRAIEGVGVVIGKFEFFNRVPHIIADRARGGDIASEQSVIAAVVRHKERPVGKGGPGPIRIHSPLVNRAIHAHNHLNGRAGIREDVCCPIRRIIHRQIGDIAHQRSRETKQGIGSGSRKRAGGAFHIQINAGAIKGEPAGIGHGEGIIRARAKLKVGIAPGGGGS